MVLHQGTKSILLLISGSPFAAINLIQKLHRYLISAQIAWSLIICHVSNFILHSLFWLNLRLMSIFDQFLCWSPLYFSRGHWGWLCVEKIQWRVFWNGKHLNPKMAATRLSLPIYYQVFSRWDCRGLFYCVFIECCCCCDYFFQSSFVSTINLMSRIKTVGVCFVYFMCYALITFLFCMFLSYPFFGGRYVCYQSFCDHTFTVSILDGAW